MVDISPEDKEHLRLDACLQSRLAEILDCETVGVGTWSDQPFSPAQIGLSARP